MTTETATAETADARQQQAFAILQQSVCLTLQCHYLGNHRAVDLNALVDAATGEPHALLAVDQRQFGTTKRLIDPKELRAPHAVISRAKSFLRSTAIQAHRIFGERTYLVPVGMVETVEARLVEFRAELAEASAALALRYEAAVERQRASLGPLFVASDYVAAADVATAFGIEWSYVSFDAPDRLATVDQALFASAQARYAQQMADAYDEVRLALRSALLQVTRDLAAKLAPGPDGSRKRFRDSALDDLTGFLETFPLRNITGDDELAAVVARLRRLTAGADPADLREFDEVRSEVLAGLAEASASLDDLVEPYRRGIRLA